MKALSVKNPWASWIIYGRVEKGIVCYKTIEGRSWGTNYRGPVVICASRKADQVAMPVTLGSEPDPILNQRGVAIGMVWIDGCRPLTSEDEQAAMFKLRNGDSLQAWLLKTPRAFKHPFRVKGQLGLFEIDDEKAYSALAGA